MNMRERIFSGQLFLDNCQQLDTERNHARKLMAYLNHLSTSQDIEKRNLINEIVGKPTNVHIEPPFYFTYGTNISFGENCYLNYSCTLIDDGKINIGSNVMLGPNVTISSVGHPIHPSYREFMFTDEVIIEDNCWIGAGVIVNPGVTIGKNCVIGSGSVVTKSIPPNSVAYGNPCKVSREINEHDMNYYYKNNPINSDELRTVKEVNKTT